MRVSINNSCNSKCPYCFAGTMGIDKASNMKEEDFIACLDWMIENDDKTLIMLGGEPTIHPLFGKFIDIVNEYIETFDMKFLLLTNGSNLNDYINKLNPKTSILINTNHPSVIGTKGYMGMLKTFETLKRNGAFTEENKSVVPGCNLHYELDDYTYFWSIVDKYDIRNVRVSVASPQNNKFLHDRDAYFIEMKEKFMNFVNEAISRRIEVNYDCSLIPPCYFTSEELIQIYNSGRNTFQNLGKCSEMFQVLPNMELSCCFGDRNYESDKKRLVSFNSTDEIKNMVHQRRQESLKNNYIKKCSNCKLKELNMCFAGCFGFTDGTIEK